MDSNKVPFTILALIVMTASATLPSTDETTKLNTEEPLSSRDNFTNRANDSNTISAFKTILTFTPGSNVSGWTTDMKKESTTHLPEKYEPSTRDRDIMERTYLALDQGMNTRESDVTQSVHDSDDVAFGSIPSAHSEVFSSTIISNNKNMTEHTKVLDSLGTSVSTRKPQIASNDGVTNTGLSTDKTTTHNEMHINANTAVSDRTTHDLPGATKVMETTRKGDPFLTAEANATTSVLTTVPSSTIKTITVATPSAVNPKPTTMKVTTTSAVQTKPSAIKVATPSIANLKPALKPVTSSTEELKSTLLTMTTPSTVKLKPTTIKMTTPSAGKTNPATVKMTTHSVVNQEPATTMVTTTASIKPKETSELKTTFSTLKSSRTTITMTTPSVINSKLTSKIVTTLSSVQPKPSTVKVITSSNETKQAAITRTSSTSEQKTASITVTTPSIVKSKPTTLILTKHSSVKPKTTTELKTTFSTLKSSRTTITMTPPSAINSKLTLKVVTILSSVQPKPSTVKVITSSNETKQAAITGTTSSTPEQKTASITVTTPSIVKSKATTLMLTKHSSVKPKTTTIIMTTLKPTAEATTSVEINAPTHNLTFEEHMSDTTVTFGVSNNTFSQGVTSTKGYSEENNETESENMTTSLSTEAIETSNTTVSPASNTTMLSFLQWATGFTQARKPGVTSNPLQDPDKLQFQQPTLNPFLDDDTYWPVAMALTIGIPSIIVLAVTITVLHRMRKSKFMGANMYKTL
ncbi:hypothetical protein CHS0354_026122 [Potamilus streckersoni]|uniref:Uncharacterized protein n=1 Tax=Potamilus streckersoni TaxID=2493646 RepID=A0AAE0S1V0_9BIVA|nr:hypothetical protein CHS0354_026122 [Potamilus streckersoni]